MDAAVVLDISKIHPMSWIFYEILNFIESEQVAKILCLSYLFKTNFIIIFGVSICRGTTDISFPVFLFNLNNFFSIELDIEYVLDHQ